LVLQGEKNIITIFLEVTDISSQSAYPLFPTSAQGENNIKKAKEKMKNSTPLSSQIFTFSLPLFLYSCHCE